MKILSFDLSMKRTGWALAEDKKIVKSGSLTISDKITNEGVRFEAMDFKLELVISENKPDLVIFPEFWGSFKTPEGGRLGLGLRAILLRRCSVLVTVCQGRNEAAARKIMGVDLSRQLTSEETEDFNRRLGKRKPGTKGVTKPKRDMKARVEAALKKENVTADNDDERDAILLLLAEIRKRSA